MTSSGRHRPTIDSSILNKPGRFTPEEYEIMKTHSPKSGEMVMILLDGIEEDRFVKVAYNVARYHHERWDGKGYPEGLVGTMIPLEARIMAVADVYDALVSKRVYKEPMSFEKSAAIMCEGMGTQFDPNMKPIFLGCRERLEMTGKQCGNESHDFTAYEEENMKIRDSLVFTNDRCVGCNKCINVCSCMGACISDSPDENGVSRIEVDGDRCIACGACFDACEHDAREYIDDTERFFEDLKKGESVSVLIAPAFKANYPKEYESVLGGLKKLGVKRFISVSFGADITTWGYIKYIQTHNYLGGISQPCPAVVGYIERYLPQLIPMLFPVQSPLMCAAIYARKQMGVTDKLAFISPCIAKKMEIEDENNHGLVQYNVTFNHLMRYVREHGISGPACTDEVEYGLGSIYPTPGGLKENVYWLLGESVFIRQIEGEKRMYHFLEQNKERIRGKKTPFLFIDALNCENGCIYGTGTDPEIVSTDDTLYHLLEIRESVKKKGKREKGAWASRLTPKERLAALNKQFSALDLNDYLRRYTDRSAQCQIKKPSDRDLEQIFLDMRKSTAESRIINCSCCGYETCTDMATAIFNGFNHKENCVHYLKELVEIERSEAQALVERERMALDRQHRSLTETIEQVYQHFENLQRSIDGMVSGNNARCR